MVPMSLAMIGLMVVGVMDAIKAKFVIDSDRILSVSTFSNKQLMFNEIKGYRVTDKFIFIESKENKREIKVSQYFEKRDEIIEWLSDNYPDLDGVQIVEETKEILHNETFGLTAEQREDNLIRASKTAKVLNWAGGLVGVWTIFFPKPYEYAILASIVIPVICIIVLKYYKGLIKIDERKATAYPTVFWAIFATSIGLGIRGLMDYHIFDHSNVWKLAPVTAFAFVAILLLGTKEFNLKKAKEYLRLAGFAMIMCAYSYGAVVSLNCIYDKSEPEKFNAAILNKRISKGKSTTYYLKLTPWGYQEKAKEVTVSRALYEKLEKDDSVHIYFRKGKFDIPWFVVTE